MVRMRNGGECARFSQQLPRLGGRETNIPREIAEAALAHVVGDATERAYRRSDALERRRGLMEMWATYLTPKAAAQ